MAAGLTDHLWSVREALTFRIPPPPFVAPKRRGGQRRRKARLLVLLQSGLARCFACARRSYAHPPDRGVLPVQTVKTPKCTFSGVVSIELQRFLDSGVPLVECPNCARTRSLEPRKGVLRFRLTINARSVPPIPLNDMYRVRLPGKSLEERETRKGGRN